MESKLSKQISSFCRLDFSNSIARKPKGLFYTKNVLQSPINFRKKSEKISLKNFYQDLASPDNKNINLKPQQIKPLSPNKKNQNRLQIKNLSAVKSSTRLITPKVCIKKLPLLQSTFKINLHRSLQQQPQRIQQPWRNPAEGMKNYGLKKIAASIKTQKFNNFQSSNNIVHKNSGNLIHENSANSNSIKVQTQPDKMISQILVQKKHEPQFIFIKQLNQSVQKMRTPQLASKKDKIQKQNLQSTNATRKFKQSLTFKQPQQRKVKPQRSSVDLEKFHQIYGEFQIQEEIKYDLLVQKQALENKMSKQKGNISLKEKSALFSQQKKQINPQQSIKSLKELNQFNDSIKTDQIKRQFQQIFYNSCDKEKSNTFNTFQQLQKAQNYPSCNLQNYQFRTEQRLRKSSISIQSQVSIQGEYINSLQFRQKCQRTDNFKSIVSVHSQSVSDQEVEASVIINKHPKEIISSRPIRSLF